MAYSRWAAEKIQCHESFHYRCNVNKPNLLGHSTENAQEYPYNDFRNCWLPRAHDQTVSLLQPQAATMSLSQGTLNLRLETLNSAAPSQIDYAPLHGEKALYNAKESLTNHVNLVLLF